MSAPETRSLPFSQEAEVAVISSVLLSGAEVLDEIGFPLQPESFWVRSHQIIWGAVQRVHLSGKPVDLITVTEYLQSLGRLEEVGGAYVVGKLAIAMPTAAHVEHYAQIIFDKWRLRQVIQVSHEVIQQSSSVEDVGEFVESMESRFMGISENVMEADLMREAHLRLLENLDRVGRGELLGLPTGIELLDEYLRGWVAGKMIVFAGEAGCGKTALFEQAIIHALFRGDPVLIIQKDMPVDAFYERLACRMADISVWRMEQGFCSTEEREKIAKASFDLLRLPLILKSPPSLTGAELRAMVRREKRKRGIKLVFLDHMRTLSYRTREQWQGITENSIQIRASANESQIPHIILNHINREGRKADRPRKENLKGCDQLLDDCDALILMWPTTERPKKIEGVDQVWEVAFDFAKNRGGPEALETLNFNGSRMRFEPKPPQPEEVAEPKKGKRK